MASKRIYVTLMLDINNDNVDEITENMVDDILASYDDTFDVEDCEVESEMCGYREEE